MDLEKFASDVFDVIMATPLESVGLARLEMEMGVEI